MLNARILDIKDLHTAEEEIRKVGADANCLSLLSQKAVFVTIKLEGLSCFEANIVKQEMLGKGGEAAVSRGVANCSTERSNVIMMGTLSQYKRLLCKLNVQPGRLKEIGEEVTFLLDGYYQTKERYFQCCKHRLAMGEQTHIMGILNVTPDSFSDGGNYVNIESAVKRAKEMVKDGAGIIDIGGESTRPGYEPVDIFEEINRVVPVVERLSKELEVPISIDTSKAVVAEKALSAGAHIINDVWGLQRDVNMADVVSKYGAGVVVMHNSENKEYGDLMGDIISFLRRSIEIADNAGIDQQSIIIDPGFGFAKGLEQNLEVMRRLTELTSLNRPILIGTSKKSMIGNILELPINERLEGTAATVTLGIAKGVDVVRVHDVKQMARVAKMTDAMVRNT